METSRHCLKLLAIFTTVGSKEDAHRIATTLVERKLVACAQVSAIDSVYRWQGRVQQEPEFRLLLKTTQDRYATVESAIRELHPYDLPAIFALPVEAAYPPYAQWVAEGSAAGE